MADKSAIKQMSLNICYIEMKAADSIVSHIDDI